jgi:WD40 repeat protein
MTRAITAKTTAAMMPKPPLGSPTFPLRKSCENRSTTDQVILDIAWSPNGDLIAMIDDSGTLNVTLSDQVTPVFQFAVTVPTLFDATVAWNPDGSLLAVGIGYQVYILETTTWQLLHQFVGGDSDGYTILLGRFEETPEGIVSINWSSDSRYVVSGSLSYLTTVWDNQSEQVIYQAPDGSGGGPGRVWLDHEGWIGDGATRLNIFSNEIVVPSVEDIQYRFGGSAEGGTTEPRPDNTQIAWGTAYGILGVIDLDHLNTIQGIRVTENDPSMPSRGISDISWDGTWNFIAAASRDGELYVVDLMAGEVMTVLKLEGRITAVDWNLQTNEIIYAGVSESGQPILSIVDVSGINGVQR